jgi:hypothetical protein
MRHIERRYLTRDGNGRPIDMRYERLTDDGLGNTHLVSEQRAKQCSGCFRQMLDISESRGRCDWCHTRECCINCAATCQVCSRRLCGHCRRGFAGPPALTVCEVCHQRLMYRQAVQDQFELQQTAFDRQMAQQRLLNDMESLRLTAERLHFSNYFEAARLGLRPPPTLMQRLLRFTWRVIVTVLDYATRPLRKHL